MKKFLHLLIIPFLCFGQIKYYLFEDNINIRLAPTTESRML